MDKTKRNDDMLLLHPRVRKAVKSTLEDLKTLGFEFKMFEGYRYPERQEVLYAQGRTTKGGIITKSKPWDSRHQFGLAADIVLFEGGKWSWSTSEENTKKWEALHAIGKKYGLETLAFEKPHLQLAGISLKDLQNDVFPSGGDETWENNLTSTIIAWKDKKAEEVEGKEKTA